MSLLLFWGGSGSGALLPDLFTNTNTFYSPTVSYTYALTPSLFTNSQTFYSPTATYSNTLAPALFTNTITFYSATVTPGAVTLTPSLFTNSQTFYSPTVAAPVFAQQAYRWYGNGAVESTLTAVAAQDTELAIDAPAGHNRHLRIRVAPTAGSAVSTTDWQLKVSYNGGAYANLAASGVVSYADLSLVDGEATTEQLTGGSGTFSAGAVSEDGLVDNIGIASGGYTELLYAIALSGGTAGDTYDFRVYKDGAALDTYGVTPRFRLNAATQALTPSLFTNSQTFYSPTVSFIIFPGLYTNSQTFYDATVTAGVVTLAPSLFTNSQTFYSSTVSSTYALTPSLFTNSQTFYSAAVSLSIAPSLFTNSQTFYAATVTPGAITVTPELFTNRNFWGGTTGSNLVTNGDFATDISGWTAGDTTNIAFSSGKLRATHVSAGLSSYNYAYQALTLTANKLYQFSVDFSDNAERLTVFAQLTGEQEYRDESVSGTITGQAIAAGSGESVAFGFLKTGAVVDDEVDFDNVVFQLVSVGTIANVVTLTPSLFTNSQTFYSPTATNLNTVTPSLFANSQTFYSATVFRVTEFLTPDLFTNTNTFYSATVTGLYTLTAPLFTNTQTFFSPSLTTTYALTPSLFTNSQTFYSPTAENDNYLLPSLVVNNQTFHSSTVTQSADLYPGAFTNVSTLYSPTVFYDGPLIDSISLRRVGTRGQPINAYRASKFIGRSKRAHSR